MADENENLSKVDDDIGKKHPPYMYEYAEGAQTDNVYDPNITYKFEDWQDFDVNENQIYPSTFRPSVASTKLVPDVADIGEALALTDETPTQILINKNMLKHYGNNYFMLSTMHQANMPVTIKGVLKELPSLSMGASFTENGPAAIADKALKFMSSEQMEMVAALGGMVSTRMVKSGELSRKKLSDCQRVGFQLQFRTYTNESIGGATDVNGNNSLTDAKEIVAILKENTGPMSAPNAGIAIVNFIQSVTGAVNFVKNAASNFGDAAKQLGKDITSADNASSTVTKCLNTVADAVDKQLSQVSNRIHGDNSRVNSSNNLAGGFGGKVWELAILPGVFKKPMVVYVQNWSYTISKETVVDANGYIAPAYYDFTINVQMDQKKSANWWIDMF